MTRERELPSNFDNLLKVVEQTQESTLSIRPHHLNSISLLYYFYLMEARTNEINIQNFLYDYTQNETDDNRKQSRMGPSREFRWRLWYMCDSIGHQNSIGEKLHIQSKRVLYKNWLTADNSTPVLITLSPDDLCSCCVEGLHCFDLTPQRHRKDKIDEIQISRPETPVSEIDALKTNNDSEIFKFFIEHLKQSNQQIVMVNSKLLLTNLGVVRAYLAKILLIEFNFIRYWSAEEGYPANIFPIVSQI